MIVSLIGFMGTGKTTVGRKLAARINYDFVDTDDFIIAREGREIPEIFADSGESYFRRLEEEVLAGIIDSKDNLVMATGGGIVLSRKNRNRLQQDTSPVLLTAAPEEILDRIDCSKRPLLADSDDPLLTIKNLMAERSSFYNEFSCKVETDRRTPEEIAREIEFLLVRGNKGDDIIEGNRPGKSSTGN